MGEIKIVAKNILEDATITVNVGADTAYPAARLYDRAVSLYWTKTGSGALVIHVDQGAAAILDIDFLAIYRHNFSGEDLAWQYSDNNVDWSAAVPGWSQADNLQIVKTLGAPAAHRYWRITVTDIVNPRCGEVWMGEMLSIEVKANPSPIAETETNVQWNRTVGKTARSTKFGDSLRRRTYSAKLSAADLTALETALADLDHYRLPFYFRDHRSAWFPARFSPEPAEDFFNPTHTQVDISVLELL